MGIMRTETLHRIQDQIRVNGFSPGKMTFGDCLAAAQGAGASAGEAVIAEAMMANRMDDAAVIDGLFSVFRHNRRAMEMGCDNGLSPLMGGVGREMCRAAAPPFTGDALLDRAVAYTLATQVGNHCMGLQPCAGTGDACTYTGMLKALEETVDDRAAVARALAVMLKLGTLFREGKSTTGCNMEGFGAGAAAAAAAFTEIANGSPGQTERAVVLAISPTIAVPCTPRVMVPGLCATHIGGGVLVGRLASHLAMTTDLPVTVPVDHMLAMAAAVHPVSAEHVVPEVARHMAPFFQTRTEVENLVADSQRAIEKEKKKALLAEADSRIRGMAARARSILAPFDKPVAGGSSQAVGSPANTARLAHFLSKGTIRSVAIELAPELFARRAINIPSVLAAAILGSAPGDSGAREGIFAHIDRSGVKVTIQRSQRAGMQQVAIQADRQNASVTADNLGGSRIRLREALPSRAEALRVASQLEIEVIGPQEPGAGTT